MKKTFSHFHRTLGMLFIMLVAVVGCAVSAPVQEMSDARQAIHAAREVEAARYAPGPLGTAERLLGEATHALEQGQYAEARSSALAARQAAISARQYALSDLQNRKR